MKRHYRFEISGTAAEGQTWLSSGSMECEWNDVMNEVMVRSFRDLTQGRAKYGKPGIGCTGPYDIDRCLITKIVQ